MQPHVAGWLQASATLLQARAQLCLDRYHEAGRRDHCQARRRAASDRASDAARTPSRAYGAASRSMRVGLSDLPNGAAARLPGASERADDGHEDVKLLDLHIRDFQARDEIA